MSSIPAVSERPGAEGSAPSVTPSALDLVRLSPRLLFPPGGRDLYRQIALLVGISSADEIIVAGCGNGVTLEYFVTEHGAHGSGVDVDAELISEAEERARAKGLAESMHFQHSTMERLPYRDEIFDVAVGELGLTHAADPSAAVEELVRVTRPGGAVVLVQPVWKAPVDAARRAVLAEHLGVRPLMLVEWKRLLRENGVERLHTEDWSDEETAFRPQVAKPFPDFAELFSLWEKIGILRRAWRKWGWEGVRTVVLREREVRRLLTRERILGLDLLKGTRRPIGDQDEGGGPVSAPPAERGRDVPPVAQGPPANELAPETATVEPEVAGLPLFEEDDDNPG